MGEGSGLDAMAEELHIRRVARAWAFGRDLGEWEALKSCFHPDATIHLSWFSGPAAEFIERSRQMAAAMRPEERSKHLLGGMRAAIRGGRALLESDVQICLREFIDGHLFDYTAYARFYDQFEKRDADWRILRKTCIYDRDRLDPVVPGSVPASFFEAVPVAGAECGFAYMRFRQEKRGRTVPAGIVLGGSVREQALRAEGEHWLARG